MPRRAYKDNKIKWEGIKRELILLDKSYTKVGIPKSGEFKNISENKVNSLEEQIIVAAVHEFGAPKKNIPERPFLRTAFDDKENDLMRFKEIIIDKIIKNKITFQQGLGLLGEFMTRAVQEKINSIYSPPLKEETIRRKTRAGKIGDKPLIDWGQLRANIQHVEVFK